MKQTVFTKILFVVTMAFMCVFMLAPTAMAAEKSAKTSFPINGKYENVTIRDLTVEIIRFLSFGVGIAVVGGIAAGGVVYATSQGNPAGTQKGITIITNSIVGLLLYLLMFALLQFLIPGGILT
jgi:hypothetical protein